MTELPATLDLVGIGEIADIAVCSKAAVSRWKKTLPDFPKPVAELRAGPVFWREQIASWLAKRASTPSIRSFKSEMIVEPKKPDAPRVRNVRKPEVEQKIPRTPYIYPQRQIGRIFTEDDLLC